MDLSKLSAADKVIGASAGLFLIATFLPWYGAEDFPGGDQIGWDYFLTGVLPLLVIVAMVALIAIQRFSTTQPPTPPIAWTQIYLVAGIVVAALLLLRVIIPSDVEVIGDLDRKYGLWIALIAAIGVGVGGLLKSQEPEDTLTGPPSTPPTPF
ncbi:MAG TPA: hypothetical protein VE575_11335 [Acidimicrobiales bacterium]|nr:hypothetical protein [Acidimicrobiales bacterium]